MNFSAASSKVCIVVECLPQIVNGFTSGFGTGIDEYTDLRLSDEGNLRRSSVSRQHDTYLKHLTDSIEKPPVGIDLLLVLGLQNQDDLDRHEVVRVIANRQNQLRGGINGKLRGVLRNSCKSRLRLEAQFSLPRRCGQRYPFRQLAFS